MSTRLIHEEMRGGMRLRLTVLDHHMVAEAIRGRDNTVLAKASCSHGGNLGPNAFKPQTSPLAKCLMDEVADKATGGRRKGPFDMLVDELWAAKQRAGRGMHKALGQARAIFFKSATPRDAVQSRALTSRRTTKRSSK
ncbi:hypothetical protein [Cupriavidus sp. UYPR2.512]|uniref:hypothetical protein n=1 Tax=Cupriavidus sp. UYPR2.512 TaxID=1080187 RepID=UPI000373AA8E|nr:hypothetical protein [Cupriavidus sp. UYPR2.512]UIF85146.1 hypothetical protein KAF44_13360 [Cupriavidus necator]